jgi:hypothetical protein
MINTPHLIAGYRFESNANDFSGNGHNGTINTNTYAAGLMGNSALFSSPNTYITVPNSPALFPTSFTVCFWANFTTLSTIATMFSTRGTQTGGIWIGINVTESSGKNNLYFDIYTPTQQRMSLAMQINSLGSWNHYTFVNDTTQNSRVIYMNGNIIQSSTVAYTQYNNGEPLSIGAKDKYSSAYYCNGSIDEMLYYSKAINQNDIKRIMVGLHPLNG